MRAMKDWKFILGAALLGLLIAFSVLARPVVSESDIQVGRGEYNQAPTVEHPLGTDDVGRDVFALMVLGIPPTLYVGLVAGGIATVLATVLGISAGYLGGAYDAVVRSLSDVVLTIPTLVVLVTIAAYLRDVSIPMTGAIVSIFAWAGPARSIRSQTLSMRERPYVRLSQLTNCRGHEIMGLELLPNLLPYVMAGFVDAVNGGILAAVGIQLLGLGPLLVPNMGMVLRYAYNGGALYQRMWWWWGPPTVTLVIIFLSLFLMSMAFDKVGNPRTQAYE